MAASNRSNGSTNSFSGPMMPMNATVSLSASMAVNDTALTASEVMVTASRSASRGDDSGATFSSPGTTCPLIGTSRSVACHLLQHQSDVPCLVLESVGPSVPRASSANDDPYAQDLWVRAWDAPSVVLPGHVIDAHSADLALIPSDPACTPHGPCGMKSASSTSSQGPRIRSLTPCMARATC